MIDNRGGFMQNIPVFTTPSGVASLTLKEIPYKGIAYIRIQASAQPLQMVKECVDFCRSAGAKCIYAAGDPVLEQYPLYTAIWRMECARACLPETDAAIFPVQQKTVETWRDIYNIRMKHVPNSATMSILDAQDMLKKGDGYFVHRGGTLLGIGKAGGGVIDAVISQVRGSGRDVLLALCKALSEDKVCVEVASVNEPAVRLYESLGFIRTAEISKWYKIV